VDALTHNLVLILQGYDSGWKYVCIHYLFMNLTRAQIPQLILDEFQRLTLQPTENDVAEGERGQPKSLANCYRGTINFWLLSLNAWQLAGAKYQYAAAGPSESKKLGYEPTRRKSGDEMSFTNSWLPLQQTSLFWMGRSL
jgi:hypothetical protein